MKLQYKLSDIVLITLVTIFLASFSGVIFAGLAVDDMSVLIF